MKVRMHEPQEGSVRAGSSMRGFFFLYAIVRGMAPPPDLAVGYAHNRTQSRRVRELATPVRV